MSRRTLARVATLALAALLVAGCLGETPEEQAARALGPDTCGGGRRGGQEEDDDEGGPEHRCGQPCLFCHSASYNPGERVFIMAGTVFARPGDTVGVGGAEVALEDAAGHQVSVLTNATGNFMLSRGSSLQQRGRGQVRVPFDLVYPVAVVVRKDGLERKMRSHIQREPNCAVCHTAALSATSAGHVVLEGP